MYGYQLQAKPARRYCKKTSQSAGTSSTPTSVWNVQTCVFMLSRYQQHASAANHEIQTPCWAVRPLQPLPALSRRQETTAAHAAASFGLCCEYQARCQRQSERRNTLPPCQAQALRDAAGVRPLTLHSKDLQSCFSPGARICTRDPTQENKEAT